MKYNVLPNQIATWKRQFLERGASVIGAIKDTKKDEVEETQENLLKKIGQQQYEIDWQKQM